MNILSTYSKKTKPQCVIEYNQGKVGVDIGDMNMKRVKWYPHRRSKWTRTVMFGFLQMLFSNIWLICRSHISSKQNMTLTQFYEEYIMSYLAANKIQVSTTHACYPKRYQQARCFVCKNSNTKFICHKCQVPLHPTCFAKYHKSVKKNRLFQKEK